MRRSCSSARTRPASQAFSTSLRTASLGSAQEAACEPGRINDSNRHPWLATRDVTYPTPHFQSTQGPTRLKNVTLVG